MKKNILSAIIIIIRYSESCSHKISGTDIYCNTQMKNKAKPAINLSKGQKYAVENKVTTNSTSEMQGQSMETNADVTSVYNIEVTDVKRQCL